MNQDLSENTIVDEIIGTVSEALEAVDEATRMLMIEEIRRLIDTERLFMAATVHPFGCPDCRSEDCIRYGFTNKGTQRFRCVDCGRTFIRWSTGNLFAYTKLEDWQWSKFAECFVNRISLRKVMEACKVCLKTAWYMRFRIMELIHRNLPSFEIKNDIETQADEMYIAESFKGNMKKAGFTMPREPYKHGMTSHSVGNYEKVCIFTAVNDLGDFYFDVCCRGNFTSEAARSTLLRSVDEHSVVATDNLGAYVKVLRSIGAKHNPHYSTEHGPINRVNALHRRINGFLRPFNGVSSKYLNLYLGYFKWLECFRSDDDLTSIEKLSNQMVTGGYTHTRSRLGEIEFPFYYDGRENKYPRTCLCAPTA